MTGQTYAHNRIAVGVSGGGRSLENLLRSESKHIYKIAAVVCSNTHCRGFELAKAEGLPIFSANFKNPRDELLCEELAAFLSIHGVDWVALAGFLKPWPVLSSWSDRVFNIHPSLLPRFGGKGFYGARVHEAVLAAKEAESGATIHRVNEVYDAGAIVAQIKVVVKDEDTAQTLAQRVFQAECSMYPRFLDDLVRGFFSKTAAYEVKEYSL